MPNEFDNAMRRHVYSLPDLLRQQLPKAVQSTAGIFTPAEAKGFTRIILTGCGDSLAAALAVRDAFTFYTGLETQALPAMEISRSLPRSLLEDESLLLIPISTSGGVARTAEAALRSKESGAFVLALTGNLQSRLSRWSSRSCFLELPPFESAPGTRNYMLSLMGLLVLALEIGKLRGNLSPEQARFHLDCMAAQAEGLEALLPEMDKKALEAAMAWRDLEAYDLVGSGSDYGTALFSQAKVFEAVGRYAMVNNTEDWMHMNCFLRRADRIGTLVLCAGSNPAAGRVSEMLTHTAGDLMRPLLFLTNEPAAFRWADPARTIPLPRSADRFSGILTQLAPISLLFGYIGQMLGEEDGRGCRDRWSFCRDGGAVRGSEIYYD